MPVSVVTVDDQAVFRAVAREVIEAAPGFELVGEASSAETAVSVVHELDPQLVLMDVRMPGTDGIEASRRIKSANPSVVVILISIEEPSMVRSSPAACGAAALVRKQDFGPAMLRDLWDVHGVHKPANRSG